MPTARTARPYSRAARVLATAAIVGASLPRSTRPRGPGRRPSRVHGGPPLRVGAIVAARDREVPLADRRSHRSDRAVADGAAVDLDARRDLGAGPAEEDLVRDEELGPVDGPLHDGVAELPRELDDRLAGDALEDVVRDRRRDERALMDHIQVRAATLRHVAARREEDRFLRAVLAGLVDRERGVDVRARHL